MLFRFFCVFSTLRSETMPPMPVLVGGVVGSGCRSGGKHEKHGDSDVLRGTVLAGGSYSLANGRKNLGASYASYASSHSARSSCTHLCAVFVFFSLLQWG